MNRAALFSMLLATGASVTLFHQKPAQAVCGSPIPDNNCSTFSPTGGQNLAEVRYVAQAGIRWSQIGFGITPQTPVRYPVDNVFAAVLNSSGTPLGSGWVKLPGTQPIDTSTTTDPVNNPAQDKLYHAYLPAFNINSLLGVSAVANGDIIAFRYELPIGTETLGLTNGVTQVTSFALFNKCANTVTVAGACVNGSTSAARSTLYSGVDPYGVNTLRTTAATPANGDTTTFFHVYQVPGPLPILGAAAAFRASRRLRRRVSSAA